MIHTMTAVYQDGVLKPLYPLPLMEGDRVEVIIVTPTPVDPNSPEQVARRERILKEFDERTAALESAEPDGDYEEGCKALDENRKGGRQLFPPEMKGITW